MPSPSRASRSFAASARFGGIVFALIGAAALAVPSCGGDDDTTGAGGTGGSAGTSATGGTAGKAGSGGTGGTAGTADAGKSGSSGSGGASGSSGAGGTAGKGGASGAGGAAGKGGAAGSAGTAGKAGAAGSAGAAGAGGAAGSAGAAGSSGGPNDAGPDISSDGSTDAPTSTCDNDAGGPVWIDAAPPDASGPDTHCIADDGGKIIVVADQCPGPDAVAPPDPDAGPEVLPDPHYGTEADDDDCKSHVSYTSTCIQRSQNVTFTVTQKWLATNMNSTGAKPYVEAYIGNHTSGTAGTPTESNGVYTISGVQFDRAGVWTVRFHFFGDCEDTDDSKHSHASFYVRVP